MNLKLSNINPRNFESIALERFRYQAYNTKVYGEFLDKLNVRIEAVQKLDDIPFLPISFFKTHRVFHHQKKQEVIFTSSGTTGMQTSKHYVSDLSIYENVFKLGFELEFGPISDYCILALLPSYLERQGSSLVYMSEKLIRWSKHPSSGFYLRDLQKLVKVIEDLERKKQKTILLGVSYALLDLLDYKNLKLEHTLIIETGGMKGTRKEMIKEEFYKILRQGFGVHSIHSEYGMTELLSQAYSHQDGHYYCPPWMKVLIRDVNDPFCILPTTQSGGINIIDLANRDSCSFIATQDLGKYNLDGSFSILGRFDNSDIRGCNLMIN